MNIPNIIWRTNAKTKPKRSVGRSAGKTQITEEGEEFREMMNYTVTESNNISIETLEDNSWALSDQQQHWPWTEFEEDEQLTLIKLSDAQTFLEKEEALMTAVECGMMSFEVFWKKRKALMGDLK